MKSDLGELVELLRAGREKGIRPRQLMREYNNFNTKKFADLGSGHRLPERMELANQYAIEKTKELYNIK